MNLAGKMSRDDLATVKGNASGASSFEDAFAGGSDGGGADLNDIFGDSQGTDPFMGGTDDIFGGGSTNSNGLGFGSTDNTFGSTGTTDIFGNQGNIFGNQGNGFGDFQINSQFNNTQQGNPQQQQAEPSMTDKMMDGAADSMVALGHILLDMVKSIRLRTMDDIGYYNRNLMLTGACLGAGGIVIGLIALAARLAALGFTGAAGQMIISGLITSGVGVIGMSTTAFFLEKRVYEGTRETPVLGEIPQSENNVSDDYESNIDSEFDDLFKELEDSDDDLEDEEDEEDDLFSAIETSGTDEEESESLDMTEAPVIDFNKALEEVGSNTVLTRQTLWNTFKTLLPSCTPQFAVVRDIDPDSDDFNALQTMCLKSIANKTGLDIQFIQQQGVSLEEAKETCMSYEMKLKRFNKIKPADLAFEIQNYLRADEPEDKKLGISVEAELSGDFFKIIATKGDKLMITLGDCFKLDYVEKYFLDTKHKLPIVVGIDETGGVLLNDAKELPSFIIAGKSRSGKSWLVLELLLNMMLFNTPEEVQFLIVDPKQSNLFKTIALMPHVFGLHDHKHIMSMMDDIINNEAPRRKKVLQNNRCDDIWAVRKKGITMPVLFIVMDEFLTILEGFEADEKKEFNGKLLTIVTQLPSLGIFPMIVAHRTTGNVDKTLREQVHFAAAVRSSEEDICDTLGLKKWGRALPNPGDTAVKASNMVVPAYAKGVAVTTDDADNMMFVETAAKAFYKMGVEVPDMSYLRACYNRNKNKIKRELGISDYNIEQYEFNGADSRETFGIDFGADELVENKKKVMRQATENFEIPIRKVKSRNADYISNAEAESYLGSDVDDILFDATHNRL